MTSGVPVRFDSVEELGLALLDAATALDHVEYGLLWGLYGLARLGLVAGDDGDDLIRHADATRAVLDGLDCVTAVAQNLHIPVMLPARERFARAMERAGGDGRLVIAPPE